MIIVIKILIILHNDYSTHKKFIGEQYKHKKTAEFFMIPDLIVVLLVGKITNSKVRNNWCSRLGTKGK